MKSVFITGTGTNIGKTIVSSWLVYHTKSVYWKPIQTGNIEDDDTEQVHKITNCEFLKPAYNFKAPLSPHIAANLENSNISLDRINLPDLSRNLIIEGAGGLLVPLNDKETILDLVKWLNVPIIIVASSELGTINHTCLTLEVARMHNLNILGVILNGPLNEDNRNSIEKFGKCEILAEVPKLEYLNQIKDINLTDKIRTILC